MANSLAVFDRGIDFSGFDLPSLSSPAVFGARFVLRYSAGAASDPDHRDHDDVAWKLCGENELRQLVAAGYDFVANSEWSETRITGGASAGAEDGAADRAFWQARGLARGASIYVSWDHAQPAPHRHDQVAAYLTEYQRALGGLYHADLYSGDVAIRAMRQRGLIRYGWRAMSDSWSGDGNHYQPGADWKAEAQRVARVSPAHIWQNGNRWYSGGADEDVILALPIGSHRQALSGQSGPPAPLPHIAPLTTPVAPTTGSQATAVTGICRVRPGDTMSAIANRCGMSLTQLEQLNPRAGHPAGNFNLIRPGDCLTVRGPISGAAGPDGHGVHVVQPGDTLFRIAAAWGVTLSALLHANPSAGARPDLIRPGDRIVHP